MYLKRSKKKTSGFYFSSKICSMSFSLQQIKKVIFNQKIIYKVKFSSKLSYAIFKFIHRSISNKCFLERI